VRVAFDRTSLSANAVLMAQALSGSDVRTDRVTALQQSIAAGTYNVSSSDVADKVNQRPAAVARQAEQSMSECMAEAVGTTHGAACWRRPAGAFDVAR